MIRPQVILIWGPAVSGCSCFFKYPTSLYFFLWLSGHWLTCAADFLETLFVWIHESFLDVYVSVLVMFMASVATIASVSVHVSDVSTRAPSPAFASISSRHGDTNVNGLMVWGQIWTVPEWLHEYALQNCCTHVNAKLKRQYGFL